MQQKNLAGWVMWWECYEFAVTCPLVCPCA